MISVVITTAHDELGLYLTYFSLLAQDDAEFIIVADGGTETKWEKLPNTRCLRVNIGSPQGSRDAGIRAAKHDTVLVIESHVIVSDPGELALTHESLGAALTFPYRTAEGPDLFDVYGCETAWDSTLWYKRLSYQRPETAQPYRVSQFGNSCFMVDRKWYLESGGYTNLLSGWGGEEQFLCLKAWMLGRECWLTPNVWQAHYLTRGAHAGRTSEGEYLRNLATVTYVLSGKTPSQSAPYFRITPEIQQERDRICSGPFGGDLNKLREHLNSLNVQ